MIIWHKNPLAISNESNTLWKDRRFHSANTDCLQINLVLQRWVIINKSGPTLFGNANTTQNLIKWNPLLKPKDVDSKASLSEINQLDFNSVRTKSCLLIQPHRFCIISGGLLVTNNRCHSATFSTSMYQHIFPKREDTLNTLYLYNFVFS